MRLARKPFYLVALGLILTGCSSLSQSPAPVVQGASSSRPAPGYPASSGPYVPPASAPVRAPEPAPQSEVIPYRAKTPVKVSNSPSSTNIPAYPMTTPVASAPRSPVPVSNSPAPMRDPDDDRPDSYKVKAGDTLYSIALNFGQDYREVAAWNQLDDPGVIKVDQVLRLTPPAEPPPRPAPVSAPVVERPADKPAVTPPVADSGTRQSPKAVKLPYSAEAVRKVGPLAEAAPRQIAPARALASLGDLVASGSRIAKASRNNAVVGAVLGAGGLATIIEDVTGQADVIGKLFDQHGLAAGIAILAAGAFVAWQSWRAGQARVQDHRTGKTA